MEMTSMSKPERITISCEDIELVGDLRVPDASGPAPGLALTGPFTGVKEQVTGRHAERLSGAGFVTLAFDHRGFGESHGRRGHEDSQGKLADLRAVLSELLTRPEVAPGLVGVVGICLGGGYAVHAAATRTAPRSWPPRCMRRPPGPRRCAGWTPPSTTSTTSSLTSARP